MVTNEDIFKRFNIDYKGEYEVHIPQMIGAVDLAKLFAELGFTRGVEIGTDEGEYAEVLCKANPNLVLDCIDPWKVEAYEPGEQPEGKEPQSYFDKRCEETIKRLDKLRVVIHRMTSMKALEYNLFEDNSLDFVYIDGNHDFPNVIQDVHHWLKKVKPGGILSGHDYVRYPSKKFNHVQKAVMAYMSSYHLLPIFLVTPTNEGMKRDRFRSWFIVKPQ